MGDQIFGSSGSGGFAPPAATTLSEERAGFWQRFGASLLDGILLAIVNFILALLLKSTAENIASLAISLAYFTILEGGPTGQTIGKRALGIRVVSLSDGRPIGYPRAAVRWIGRIISFLVILLGYFWMLWDGQKQCWHDKMANDVVVPASAYPVSRS